VFPENAPAERVNLAKGHGFKAARPFQAEGKSADPAE